MDLPGTIATGGGTLVGVSLIIRMLYQRINRLEAKVDSHRKESFEDFVTDDKHELLCSNATLRLEKKIDDMERAIISAIREGNGKPKGGI